MVCLSGGKDSYGMLDICSACARTHRWILSWSRSISTRNSRVSPRRYCLPTWRGMGFYILEKMPIASCAKVIPEGKPPAACVHALRRAACTPSPREIGANQDRPGHHRDDRRNPVPQYVFNGKLKAMPPKLLSDDRLNVVIRPLAYCRGKDLDRYAATDSFPSFPAISGGSCGEPAAGAGQEYAGRLGREYPVAPRSSSQHLQYCTTAGRYAPVRFRSLRVDRDADVPAIAEDTELYFPPSTWSTSGAARGQAAKPC